MRSDLVLLIVELVVGLAFCLETIVTAIITRLTQQVAPMKSWNLVLELKVTIWQSTVYLKLVLLKRLKNQQWWGSKGQLRTLRILHNIIMFTVKM